ncbi:hypothetical protein N7486_009716 [Penicillium sp. IBT 16267x]|nr:hypothetical protein N7486_009716 [Penicillium sp. IBT 16267x]
MSHLGLQSNVIIAASYTNTQAGTEETLLSREILYPAIRQVVQRYPELSMVTFARPSATKKSHHRRWTGYLRQINLDNHVRFIQISPEEEEAGLRTTMERYHGLWFENISETPPWQLIVVNGRHTLFVFNHYLTDGRGATYILGGLLEALNKPSEKTDEATSPLIEVTLNVPGFPEADPWTRAGSKPSTLVVLWLFLVNCLIQFSYRFAD